MSTVKRTTAWTGVSFLTVLVALHSFVVQANSLTGKNDQPDRVDCDCASPSDPFGGFTVQITQGQLVDNWDEVSQELIGDHAMLGACVDSTATQCGPAVALWEIITEAREQKGLALVGHLNRTINLSIKPFEPSEWLIKIKLQV